MKRNSLQSTTQRIRPSYGKPYRIYTEVANAGKNFAGTKLRVKWKFGWSENDADHEVEFIYSTVSGKKNVYEDGTEIHSEGSTLFGGDFLYSWNSPNCNHVFRIEALISLTAENQFYFFVDGQNFNDLSSKKGRSQVKQVDDDELAGSGGRYEGLPRPSSGASRSGSVPGSAQVSPRSESSREFYEGKLQSNGSARPRDPNPNPPSSAGNPRPTSADPRKQGGGTLSVTAGGAGGAGGGTDFSNKSNSKSVTGPANGKSGTEVLRADFQSPKAPSSAPTNSSNSNQPKASKLSSKGFDLFDDVPESIDFNSATVSTKPKNTAKATKNTFDLLDAPMDNSMSTTGNNNQSTFIDLFSQAPAAPIIATSTSATPTPLSARLQAQTALYTASAGFDPFDLPAPVPAVKPKVIASTSSTSMNKNSSFAAPMANPFEDFVVTPVKAPPPASSSSSNNSFSDFSSSSSIAALKPMANTNPFDVLSSSNSISNNSNAKPSNSNQASFDPFNGLDSKPVIKPTSSAAPMPMATDAFSLMGANAVSRPNLNPLNTDPFAAFNSSSKPTPMPPPPVANIIDPFSAIYANSGPTGQPSSSMMTNPGNFPGYNNNNNSNIGIGGNNLMQKNAGGVGAHSSIAPVTSTKSAIVDMDTKLSQIGQSLAQNLSLNNNMTTNASSTAANAIANRRLSMNLTSSTIASTSTSTSTSTFSSMPPSFGMGGGGSGLNNNANPTSFNMNSAGGFSNMPGGGVNNTNTNASPFDSLDWKSMSGSK